MPGGLPAARLQQTNSGETPPPATIPNGSQPTAVGDRRQLAIGTSRLTWQTPTWQTPIVKPMHGTDSQPTARHRRRPLILLALAAAIIVGLCLYKVTRTYDASTATAASLRPAPLFTLYNQHSQLVRLERYLGRHSILIVFFDGQRGADQDPVLQRAITLGAQHNAHNVIVVGISQVIPQLNRQALTRLNQKLGREAGSGNSLQLLSDLDFQVHRQWRCYADNHPQSATFLIDRAGRVAWSSGAPSPLPNPLQTVDRLLSR